MRRRNVRMGTKIIKFKSSKGTEAEMNGSSITITVLAERGDKFHRLEKSHRLPPYGYLGDMQQHVSTCATEFASAPIT